MVDVVRRHERMIGAGPNVRIEQGPIAWVIYTRESTGVEIVDGKVTKAGCHPIVKDNNVDPADVGSLGPIAETHARLNGSRTAPRAIASSRSECDIRPDA